MPPKKPQPDPDVVDILTRWLAEAKAGTLRSVFVVGEHADGYYLPEEYLAAEDADDLLFEVRTAVIRCNLDLLREPH